MFICAYFFQIKFFNAQKPFLLQSMFTKRVNMALKPVLCPCARASVIRQAHIYPIFFFRTAGKDEKPRRT